MADEYTWDDMVEDLKQEYKDIVTKAEKLAKRLDGFISKDKAIDALCLDCAEETKCKDFCGTAKRILYLPTANDVVPVVRCADCKWMQCNMRGDGYLPNGVPECECRHWCGAVDPTDFCSRGERR